MTGLNVLTIINESIAFVFSLDIKDKEINILY